MLYLWLINTCFILLWRSFRVTISFLTKSWISHSLWEENPTTIFGSLTITELWDKERNIVIDQCTLVLKSTALVCLCYVLCRLTGGREQSLEVWTSEKASWNWKICMCDIMVLLIGDHYFYSHSDPLSFSFCIICIFFCSLDVEEIDVFYL